MSRIIFGLLGAGGFGREVMPYAKTSVAIALGVDVGLIDLMFVETDVPAKAMVNGHPVVALDVFNKMSGEKYFNIAIADGRARETLQKQVSESAKLLTIRSPYMLDFACNEIGEGAILCPNVIITANARIGRFFHANIYSYVAHDCVIGDYVTFAPGVRCNGRIHIGDHVYIGTNAVLREGSSDEPLVIGTGAVVGMGAIVTKNVPDGVTVIGNPAKPFNRK